MKIFGVEILNEGSGVSIDDAVTEMQATFVARYVEPWVAQVLIKRWSLWTELGVSLRKVKPPRAGDGRRQCRGMCLSVSLWEVEASSRRRCWQLFWGCYLGWLALGGMSAG